MSEVTHIGPDPAERVERRWATISIAIVALLVVMAAFAGIHEAVMPQTRIETIDPRTLHIAGEFIESNLGSAVEPDGSVVVRFIAQQFSFTPQCLLVPADTPVTLRTTSADVVHGLLIADTNVNTMVVPGYISQVHTVFRTTGDLVMPCHEFCGLGHSQMIATVRVVPAADFKPDATGRASCDDKL